MSNLKLPSLSHESFMNANFKQGETRTVGYATTAERVSDTFVIRHHGSVIARIARDQIILSNAGWESNTTTMRLHAVAVDNGLWLSGYGIAKRDGETCVIDQETSKPITTFADQGGSVNFQVLTRSGEFTVWTLTAVN